MKTGGTFISDLSYTNELLYSLKDGQCLVKKACDKAKLGRRGEEEERKGLSLKNIIKSIHFDKLTAQSTLYLDVNELTVKETHDHLNP